MDIYVHTFTETHQINGVKKKTNLRKKFIFLAVLATEFKAPGIVGKLTTHPDGNGLKISLRVT